MNPVTGNNLADNDLVDRVLQGDTRAFAVIIKNTERLVAQIVFKMVRNGEDRKDIAQDIYIKAFKKLPGFEHRSKLSTWIASISYNTCLDYLKKKKLLLPGLDSGDDDTNMRYGTDQPAEDVLVFKKELAAILQEATEQLPPVYTTLITLYHKEEMSYDEIMQITGMPEGTIKNYLFRARKTLKEYLLKNYKQEEL